MPSLNIHIHIKLYKDIYIYYITADARVAGSGRGDAGPVRAGVRAAPALEVNACRVWHCMLQIIH